MINPDPIQPGGVIEVRGEDLGADLDVRVVLQGSEADAEIGTAIADGEGHITAFLQVPVDTTGGMYALILVTSTDGNVARAPLQVAGSPIVEGGGPNPLEREAIPVTSARAPTGAGEPATVRVPRPTEVGDFLVLIAEIAFPLGAGLVLVNRRRRASVIGSR